MSSTTFPYLLFYLGEEIYAFSVEFVREMLLIPNMTALPKASAHVRGVVNLRGSVVKVIDLRIRLGMRPLAQELQDFDQMLTQLKQDHVHWLEELEACIHEEREFQLAINPHECRFGRWYDSFRTNNGLLAKYLPRFEAPHNAIHETASEALSLLRAGRPDEALSIIAAKRKTALADVIRLFDNIIQLLRESNTEIAVVMASEGQPVAVSVDRVLCVEHLPDEHLQDPPEVIAGAGDIAKIGRRRTDELVTILHPGLILNEAGSIAQRNVSKEKSPHENSKELRPEHDFSVSNRRDTPKKEIPAAFNES